jgi:hypothetical protein
MVHTNLGGEYGLLCRVVSELPVSVLCLWAACNFLQAESLYTRIPQCTGHATAVLWMRTGLEHKEEWQVRLISCEVLGTKGKWMWYPLFICEIETIIFNSQGRGSGLNEFKDRKFIITTRLQWGLSIKRLLCFRNAFVHLTSIYLTLTMWVGVRCTEKSHTDVGFVFLDLTFINGIELLPQ